MFKQFFDQFWPKAVEYVAEQGLNNVKNIEDFGRILETLQKNLKLLNAKVSDVEEEIKNRERSGRKKRKREVEEWLENVRSIGTEVDELGSQVELQGYVIMRLLDGGGKAAQLNMQVEKLLQQGLDFREPVLDARGTREVILLTYGMVGEASNENLDTRLKLLEGREVSKIDVDGMVGEASNESLDTHLKLLEGREVSKIGVDGMVGEASNENLETILKLLEGREVSKIGVYGMGGVGKTALANHVYNRLVQQSQGRVFWITVSQEFTVRSLQDKIARCLGVDLSDEDEEVIRAGRLNRYFTQLKNSVLILDDVWERIDMSKVGCTTFSAEGCRLIITTRSIEVCRQIGCEKLIPVVKLGKEEAWMLFNKTLENETELSPQVEEIAKSMTKLCGGLPLGIITVARSMKGETTIHTWRNALAELKECVRGQDETGEVEEVFKVLKYSFDRLKRNRGSESNGFNMIQHCFLHYSLYPEGLEIGRDDLVKQFISDGLLDERRSRREQFEQGHSILYKLVNLCLLESCVNYENLECVKMHDLVRSMALRICKGKYMVRAGDESLEEIPEEEEWTKDLEKVSLMMCQIRIIKGGISPNCPKLSTLLLSWNPWLSAISNSFFCKMPGLCTLDLGNTKVRMLPNSVCDLTCLKALLLENCTDLVYVPNLGKLKALRELDLSGTAIKEVPQGLDQLLQLEFLSLMDAHKLMKLPSGLLLKLVHLQKVSTPFHLEARIEDIQNLKLLEDFSGSMRSVEDFNRLMGSWDSHRVYTIIVGELDEVKVCSFESSSYKRKLDLAGCNLEGARVSGQDTEYLVISGCEGLSISFLDGFPVLRILRVEFCRGIDCILRSAQESQFSNTLEEIQLVFLADLKGVVMQRGGIGASASAAQPAVFSSLKQLQIRSCNKMRKVGLLVWGLPKLELISIGECAAIEEIFEDERIDSVTTLPKLSQLSLHGLPRLRKLGLPVSGVPNLEVLSIEWCEEIEEIFEDEGRACPIVITLPKFKQLHLEGLPRLRNVSKATILCNSVENIHIEECPRLMTKLPLHMDVAPPPFLRSITVEREWWESLEWDNPDLPKLLQPFPRL